MVPIAAAPLLIQGIAREGRLGVDGFNERIVLRVVCTGPKGCNQAVQASSPLRIGKEVDILKTVQRTSPVDLDLRYVAARQAHGNQEDASRCVFTIGSNSVCRLGIQS